MTKSDTANVLCTFQQDIWQYSGNKSIHGGCHLFGAKPLYVLLVTYCQLNLKEQTSVKFESIYKLSFDTM